MLRPRVTLVVPAGLCPVAIQVLRRDAVIAGAARPQVTMVPASGAPTRLSR